MTVTPDSEIPKYNVLVGVVEVIATVHGPQDAIRILERRLQGAGFETYSDGTNHLPHAFESEKE